MKVYVVSSGNEEFHRVWHVDSDWNRAIKFCIEDLSADEIVLPNSRMIRDGQTIWEIAVARQRSNDYTVLRITQVNLT